MRRLLAAALIAAATTAACGPSLVWRKPQMTAEQFQKDDAECRFYGQQAGWNASFHVPISVVIHNAYDRCMRERGYRLEPGSGLGAATGPEGLIY